MAAHVKLVLFRSIFAAILITAGNGERTKDKMYETIDGAASCFRRLNGTHQFGCSSSRGGDVGVVHIVKTTEDLNWLLETSSAGPYIVVMGPTMFNRPVLKSLQGSDKVSGVVLADTGRPTDYSPEDVCPNRYSGLSSYASQTCNDVDPVNPWGSSLLQEDWGYPLFHIDNATIIASIEKCFAQYNAIDMEDQQSRALCSLELNAFMFAAVDSKTCMRRGNLMASFKPIRYCDPLGDQNIYTTLFPRSKTSQNTTTQRNSTLYVLASRMDATSMFDSVVPGAVTPTTGIVTLLSTAEILTRMFAGQDTSDLTSNVLFLLLHGESYDYIGSSRVVYEMKKKQFPAELTKELIDQPALIDMKDIAVMLELGQISLRHALFTHNVTSSVAQKDFFQELYRVSGDHGLPIQASNATQLPPASIQSFLKEDPQFPGILVTDHDKQYTNRFYHSIYDDAKELGYEYASGSDISLDSIQQRVSDISITLAKTFYHSLTGARYTGSVGANITLVDELLHCYLNTTNCTVFLSASISRNIPDLTPSHYVGVGVHTNILTLFTANTLAWLTGDKTNITEEQCHSPSNNKLWQYIWMNGQTSGQGNDTGVCVRTTVDYSAALSPAFLIDDYEWTSGQYSTWTESIWQEFTVRMFLKAPRAQEVVTLIIGVVVLVLAFVVTYMVDRKSATLFGNRAVSAAL